MNSTINLLISNLHKNQIHTIITLLDHIKPSTLKTQQKKLKTNTQNQLNNTTNPHQIETTTTLNLKYLKQNYKLPIKITKKQINLNTLHNKFHQKHKQIYNFTQPNQPIKLINL